jgi:lysophospholipase L1-like esterase
MNWTPYWGDASQARIIHFHGLNPREYERPNPELIHLNRGDYQKISPEWMKALKEADESLPCRDKELESLICE